MAEPDAEVESERWGDDARLEALMGADGAARFRALLEGFPDAVGVLWALRDGGGAIADFALGYGNPKMMRSFALPAAMAERYTLLEALPQMRGSRALDAYVRVCESGRPWVEEVTYDTPFGDGYMLGTFAQRAARLGDGLLIVLTDVTAQRRMEAELRSYAEVVSHDLREPITAVAVLVGLLERHPHEPPPDDVLRVLRASADRARSLIDGVLSYARMGELQRQRVALDRLVADVTAELRPSFEQAGATIEAGALPEVDGDPQQLRRVLSNLLTNAVRFRGEQPPLIELSALRRGREWVITVRDNGIGVDPGRGRRIFDMFARGASGVDGTGIGLAVCRRVVEAHGGRIWVEPAAGGGSAFSFTLPL